MKLLVWVLFFIGWTLLIMGYVQTYQQCPPPEVEYRYIPRTVLNEQLSDHNTDSSDMYKNLEQSYGRINL